MQEGTRRYRAKKANLLIYDPKFSYLFICFIFFVDYNACIYSLNR